jgi:hypothetical protein
LRKWLPDTGVRAVILGLHGFNDYSRAFEIPGRLGPKTALQPTRMISAGLAVRRSAGHGRAAPCSPPMSQPPAVC